MSKQQTRPSLHTPAVTPSTGDAPLRRYRWIFAIAVILITIVIFAAVTYHWVQRGDYPSHFAGALTLQHNPLIRTAFDFKLPSYPLYHLVFMSFWWLALAIYQPMAPGANFNEMLIASSILSGALANLTFHIVLGLALYFFLFNRFAKFVTPLKAGMLSVVLTGALLVVTAINFVFTLDGSHYFGYIPLTPQHNPTVIAVKPFALLLCAICLYLLQADDKIQPKWIAAAFVATILANIAKPTYAICLLPALAVYTIPIIVRREWRKLVMLLTGIMLPMLITLSVQYFNTFGESDGNIIWSPFTSVKMYSTYIPVKILLSILFPAVVYLAFFRQARRHFTLNFSWLVFGISACYLYLFAEAGNRARDGNLGWSAMTCLFIVFYYTVLFLVEHWQGIWKVPRQRLTYLLCWAVFVVHVGNGVVWLNYLMHSTQYN